MVKNSTAVVVLAFFALMVFSGCNQSPAPVTPRDGGPSLSFSFPIPSKPSSGSTKKYGAKKDSVALTYGTLRYRMVSGNDVVTGAIDYNYSYQYVVGNVSVPLPHNGTWLVSAEWFDYGNSPRFIGADQVNVQGSTAFTLQMGDVTLLGCSYDYFGDTGNCYYPDLFTFDNAQSASSTILGSTGDIQFKYDSNAGNEYITTPGGTSLSFAYLGTGNWVDYTSILTGTVYYPDTQAAKTAVLGAGNGMMAQDDIYVVQLSPTSHVWIQISSGPYFCGSGDYVYISYRGNFHGYPYMKYDATTYDQANCQNRIYYPGGG